MIKYDSKEEQDFAWWLEEAEKNNLAAAIVYQPDSFTLSNLEKVYITKQLKTKNKLVVKNLLQPHIYTADFKFMLLDPIFNSFFKCGHELPTYVDVKGTFQMYGGQRSFSINQKWVYKEFGIYVQKVIPEKLFKKTWVPERCRLSPVQKKPVKKYLECKSIEQFLSTGKHHGSDLTKIP